MKQVTVVGSINIDLFSYLDRWPKIGETVTVREAAHALGGKGANQAAAATRLGAKALLIGAIGKDGFGQEAANRLAALKVTAELIEKASCSTGMAFIDVGPDSNNMIRLSSGANGVLSPANLEVHSDQLANSGAVLLQNEIGIETSLSAAEIARKGGALVIMDPAPAPVPLWPAETLASFDILTPNASEAGALLGKTPETLEDALSGAAQLRERGLRGAIITMGEKGVAWSYDEECGTQAAPVVNSIDTVAAGDCFNGALATALVQGKSMSDSIQFAMSAAALATTRKGASESLPSLAELESFLSSSTSAGQQRTG